MAYTRVRDRVANPPVDTDYSSYADKAYSENISKEEVEIGNRDAIIDDDSYDEIAFFVLGNNFIYLIKAVGIVSIIQGIIYGFNKLFGFEFLIPVSYVIGAVGILYIFWKYYKNGILFKELITQITSRNYFLYHLYNHEHKS